jgi:hypothetical protein
MLQLARGRLERLWRRNPSSNPQNDPGYEQNVEKLIERSRSFENSK